VLWHQGFAASRDNQLARYFALLDTYQQHWYFHVCWAPIADFHLSDNETLTQKILPFLTQAEKLMRSCGPLLWWQDELVMLAAWLVSGRGLSNKAALLSGERAEILMKLLSSP